MSKKTTILLVAILIPILCLIGIFVFLGKPQEKDTKVSEPPYISDLEMKQRVVFTTNDLNENEKNGVISFLLENKHLRSTISDSEKIDFHTYTTEGETVKICRDEQLDKYPMLIGKVTGKNNDRYKTGSVYIVRKDSKSNWLECNVWLGNL